MPAAQAPAPVATAAPKPAEKQVGEKPASGEVKAEAAPAKEPAKGEVRKAGHKAEHKVEQKTEKTDAKPAQ